MFTAPTGSTIEPTPARRLQRRRAADRAAGRLFTAMTDGLSTQETAHYLDYRNARIGSWPLFEKVVQQAATVATNPAPGTIHTARTVRGHLCVVRLHGPDWSLVLSHGRPLPGILLAVEDYSRLSDGQPTVWRLRFNDHEHDIAAMNQAILATVDGQAATP